VTAADREGFDAPPGGTGHPRVDEALSGLAAAADASPAEQVAPLAAADRALREALDSIDDV
jgi:hypothetical protein